jgi:PPOX class probable FMN-dependent enzyme
MHDVTRYIETEEELDQLIPIYRPRPGVPDKLLTFVDDHARAFIATSPLVMVGTSGADGSLDVSPRGDPPGFVKVLGDHRLLIPDRKGNHRLDTMRNVLATGRIGCLFLVPGREDTLRVNGRARITADPDLVSLCTVQEKVPAAAIVLDVEELYFHCARSLLRGGAWTPDTWPDSSGLASLGRAMKDQMNLTEHSAEQIDADLAQVNCDLY